jgi:hypothetical protein
VLKKVSGHHSHKHVPLRDDEHSSFQNMLDKVDCYFLT